MRGSADYKRHLAAELTIRALRTSVGRVLNTPDSEGS
jgi:carbon-monoxide dehydrogenase medium subunit